MARQISVSDLNGTIGFRIPGIRQADFVGSQVAGGFDFNGDGLDDLLISAPGAARGGAAYIIYGKLGAVQGTFDLSSMSKNDGAAIFGVPVRTLSFKSASVIGDVDGDGLDDFAIARDGDSFQNGPDIFFRAVSGGFESGFPIRLASEKVASDSISGGIGNGECLLDKCANFFSEAGYST